MNTMIQKYTSPKGLIVLRGMVLALILCCSSAHYSSAQIFWSESFGNGCNPGLPASSFNGNVGPWTQTSQNVNDPFANEWYVSATSTGLPAGSCTNNCQLDPTQTSQSLHIGNVVGSPNAGTICFNGDCGALYDAGGFAPNQVTTDKRAESPVINCAGRFNITLKFNYIEGGNTIDNGTVEYFDGVSWAFLTDPAKTDAASCSGLGKWTAFSIALPASANNNPNVKIGFRWVNNDDALTTGPSFAIDSITLSAVVTPVVANFSVDSLTACAGSSLHFTDLSSGNPISWSWAFVGGTPALSSSQNPVVTYLTPGVYTVKLIAINSSDTDTIIRTNYITINNCVPPVADFIVSDTAFCQNHCVNFTDLSTNNPTSWIWTFQNSSSTPVSNLQNPQNVCYSTPGFYYVQLIAINAYGRDTVKKDGYIHVIFCPPPVPDFVADQTTGCDTVCVNFTDLSTNTPLVWSWQFPGANPDTSSEQNPQNICYEQDGLYDVILTVTNDGGTDSIVKYSYISIVSVPNATISNDTSFAFGGVDTIHATGGVAYQWFHIQEPDNTMIPDTMTTPDIVVSPPYTTTYFVVITGIDGCHTIRQVVVTVTRKNRVFIPDAFSPDGDGHNDLFRIRGNNIFSARLVVYDRWGTKMFETDNKDEGWDGTFNGKKLNSAVFTYVAFVIYNLENINDNPDASTTPETTTETGTVALIR